MLIVLFKKKSKKPKFVWHVIQINDYTLQKGKKTEISPNERLNHKKAFLIVTICVSAFLKSLLTSLFLKTNPNKGKAL